MLITDVDRATFAVGMVARLRDAGVRSSLTAAETFTAALGAVAPGSRDRLYWTARISLVHRHADLAAFDAVFAEVFDRAAATAPNEGHSQGVAVSEPVARPAAHGPEGPAEDADGLPWTTLATTSPRHGDEDDGVPVPELRPSGAAALADVPFDQLTPDELAHLGAALSQALRSWPTRRTRRHVHHRSGRRVALRPTLARARRTGWEPVELVRTRAASRPRRLVVVCDVSRSMQSHATALLHLMRASTGVVGAEVFAFSTSLTRLTPVLAHRSPERAVEMATEAVDDRFGGTRIATSLRALLASRHGHATRGAIIVVASDGWDSDPPAELAAVMARLRRRAHRVVWLNPRVAAPGFVPTVGSMAASLPHCDRLLPAHTFRALADALTLVAEDAAPTARTRR